MKKLICIVLACTFLTGCTVFGSATKLQPKGVKYYTPEQQLFNIQAAEITFKAPVIETVRKDGSRLTEPVMKTVSVTQNGVTTTTTEPVLANFWVKDTNVKPPMTGFDLMAKVATLGLTAYLGGEALACIQSVSEIASSKQPLVVNQTKTDYVTVDGEGEVDVNRS